MNYYFQRNRLALDRARDNNRRDCVLLLEDESLIQELRILRLLSLFRSLRHLAESMDLIGDSENALPYQLSIESFNAECAAPIVMYATGCCLDPSVIILFFLSLHSFAM